MYWGDSSTERDALTSPLDKAWEKPVGFGEAYRVLGCLRARRKAGHLEGRAALRAMARAS